MTGTTVFSSYSQLGKRSEIPRVPLTARTGSRTTQVKGTAGVSELPRCLRHLLRTQQKETYKTSDTLSRFHRCQPDGLGSAVPTGLSRSRLKLAHHRHDPGAVHGIGACRVGHRSHNLVKCTVGKTLLLSRNYRTVGEDRCRGWASHLGSYVYSRPSSWLIDLHRTDVCREEGTIATRDIRENKMKKKKTGCDLRKVLSEGTRIQQRRVIWLLFSNHRDRRSVILVSLVLNGAMPLEMSLWTPKRKESSEEVVQRQETVMVSDARWQSSPVFKCMMAHVRTPKGQWGHSSQVNTKISCYVTILPAWT